MFEDFQIVIDALLDPPSSMVPVIWLVAVGMPIAMIVAGEVILRIEDSRVKFVVFCACVGLLGFGANESMAALARRPVGVDLVMASTAGLLAFAAILDWFALHIVPGWWHDFMEHVENHPEPDSKPHIRLLSQLGRKTTRNKAATEKTARKLRFHLSRFIHRHDCDMVVFNAGEIRILDRNGEPIAVIDVAERRVGRRKRLRFSLRDRKGHVHARDVHLNEVTPEMVRLVTEFFADDDT